jgi:uncharacterized protein YqgC (DUF456 family)
MPLNIRSIAVSIAVVCFFSVSLIAWISGHSPDTCSKRALVGAVIGYIAGIWVVKAVNAIFISAMVTEEINQEEIKQEEVNDSDNRD